MPTTIKNTKIGLLKVDEHINGLQNKNNRDLLLWFKKSLVIDNASDSTILNYLNTMEIIESLLDKDLDSITETDVMHVLDYIEKYTYTNKSGKLCTYTDATKYAKRAGFKRFLHFIGHDTSLIKNKQPTKTKLPEDMLTKEEIIAMVDAARNPRDKAFIITLYETGARISELALMQLKHVEFDNNGAVLKLSRGETGSRRVRVVNASMYLRQWIDSHPRKQEQDAPLWTNIKRNNEQPSYTSFRYILKRAAKIAGVQKAVNPHAFRHARASHLSKHLTEQQMKVYLGWTAASPMAAAYVNMSDNDVDDTILKMHGLNIEDDAIDTMQPDRCPRCHELNMTGAMFCIQCGQSLTRDGTASKDIDAEKYSIKTTFNMEMMEEALKDPDVLELMQKLQEKISMQQKVLASAGQEA